MAKRPDAIAYPLKMSAVLDPKPWGGRRLGGIGKVLPDKPIGESLESGSESRISNGPLAGRTLGDIVRSCSRQLLGSRGEAVSGRYRDFPLLIKFIDAHENLSVQVHPGDADAPEGKRGKTEAWLILDAEPESRLIVGIDGPPEPDRIDRQIVSEGVAAGDVFFTPAGTVHAIGAGVLLYEVQQASDVTYRLYDWGRKREMHWDEGARAARSGQRATRVTPLALAEGRDVLVACRHFGLELWSVRGGVRLAASPEAFRVITVLQGELEFSDVSAMAGDTLVLPADLHACVVEGSATFLMAYIPDLATDIVGPLSDAGHSSEEIAALGVGW